MQAAQLEINRLRALPSLFISERDNLVKSVLGAVSNNQITIGGPARVLGKVYDSIGYDKLPNDFYFKHLVFSRLLHPSSKNKTVDYLYRYLQVEVKVDTIYEYMDNIENNYKKQIEQITYAHTKNILNGKIGVVFYDMTTLYFQIDREDHLRKPGYSKDGKSHLPQIKLGVVVGALGYPIGYDIFDGNTFEGNTLIPVLEQIQAKFAIKKPIIVADAGLLSKDNIDKLKTAKYEFILGGRLKGESEEIKNKILSKMIVEGKPIQIRKEGYRLIVSFSQKRAKKDAHNRERGLKRLEKNIKSGKLNKSHINNRGYNKYLSMEGETKIQINYDKYREDAKWDGLKAYVTNSKKITKKGVINAYSNLWHIEKAFRITKFELKTRPIYHRLEKRIRAHICLCFAAYAVYKELERKLYKANAPFSVSRAIELTKTMYQIQVRLPDSNVLETIPLQMSLEQQQLVDISG